MSATIWVPCNKRQSLTGQSTVLQPAGATLKQRGPTKMAVQGGLLGLSRSRHLGLIQLGSQGRDDSLQLAVPRSRAHRCFRQLLLQLLGPLLCYSSLPTATARSTMWILYTLAVPQAPSIRYCFPLERCRPTVPLLPGLERLSPVQQPHLLLCSVHLVLGRLKLQQLPLKGLLRAFQRFCQAGS